LTDPPLVAAIPSPPTGSKSSCWVIGSRQTGQFGVGANTYNNIKTFMKLNLDDESARMAADLRLLFRQAIADSIQKYFEESRVINWTAVTVGLMMVSADTNNTVNLEADEAKHCFAKFTAGHHYRSSTDIEH